MYTHKNIMKTSMPHKWFYKTISISAIILVLFALLTIIIDPWFHYHAPLDKLSYHLKEGRNEGDGILRNWDYDTLFIGTSMIGAFTPSMWDEINNTKSVKSFYEDASYYEIDQRLQNAFAANPNIKTVIRALDDRGLVVGPYTLKDGIDYPDYIYDDNILNDTSYFLNKTIFLDYTIHTLIFTLNGNASTSMDAYWNDPRENFNRGFYYTTQAFAPYIDTPNDTVAFDKQSQELTSSNLEINVLSTISAHPNTEFIIFFPPYSIAFWGWKNNEGAVDFTIDSQKYAIERLLDYDNVKLFSFDDNFELITDFDRYSDYMHYDTSTCQEMINWILSDTGRLTKDNYQDYIDEIRNFYTSYDYTTLNNTEGISN